MANFEKVKQHYVNGIDLFILGQKQKEEKKTINGVTSMQDGQGNYRKALLLLELGTGIIKKLSRHSGQERETQKSLPAVWEQEFRAFPLENILEQELPLCLIHR